MKFVALFIFSLFFSLQSSAQLTDYNGNDLTLSTMSLEEAHTFFDEVLLNPEDIPYAYPDGCYAKAQKLSLLLDDLGVISAKAFIEGNLFYGQNTFWTFHVATTVMVQSGETVLPYVLDPFLFETPQPYEVWKSEVLKDRRTTMKEEYFTNRFVYSPGEKTHELNNYSEVLLRDMEVTFKQFRKKLKNRGKGCIGC